MKRVLIVDHGKAALVMSSELIKECISGVTVEIARTGKEAVEKVKMLNDYDLILVEFDMPDADGIAITNMIRRHHDGPIFVSAFPDDIVKGAMNKEMYAFDDARDWLRKPLKKDQIKEKIELFVNKKFAVHRRFFTLGLDSQVVGKAAGRGKRAPKADGILQNISFGGACICSDDAKTLKNKHELTLTIMVPEEGKSKKAKPVFSKQNFKGKVAWKKDDRIGIEFTKMTESQRKKLETFILASM